MPEQYYDDATAMSQARVGATDDMADQRQAVCDLLSVQVGQAVLDIGSGNGELANDLATLVGPSGRVVGVDAAPAMVASADPSDSNTVFVTGDAQQLPFDDGDFDAATATQVFCFVPDLDRAVAELWRVLRPGGRAVILDTEWDSVVWHCRDASLRDRILTELTSGYAANHVPARLTRALTTNGFDIVQRVCHPIVNWEMGDNYSTGLLGFLADTDDGAAWRREMDAAVERGEYLFSISRYLFLVTK
ncbi:MAG: methyltransferase domain-containing protein [Actinomycetota bacterium]